MAYNFPDAPTLGQIFQDYVWDGEKWTDTATSGTAYAPIASPVFTGNPQAPTPTAGDTDTSVATTAFVANAVAAIGVGGMSTAEYTYSTTITAPPSTGQLRGNNATQSAITAFYLHETNAVGVDITNALKIIATGVKILVQDKTNSANVQYYVTSGPAVDNGVYFTIPVTWVSTGSGTSFTAGRVIFAGFGIGSNNMPEAPTDGQIYGRKGSDTSWQAAVAKAGDTMTGALTVAGANPEIDLNKNASGGANFIIGKTNGLNRWSMRFGNSTAEGGSNAGSDFALIRYDDAGAFVGSAFQVMRNNGATMAMSGFTAAGTTPGSQPGNSNTLTGFEIDGNAMLFSSVGTNWNANWNRNSAGNVHTFTVSGGGLVGNISVTASATAYNTSSSGELKEDLKSFDAGNIVDATNVYDFKWKNTEERAFGVIAQEAVEVYPLAVTHSTEKDDWWGVDYSKYVPVLLQEMKALRARVAELEGQLTVKPAASE